MSKLKHTPGEVFEKTTQKKAFHVESLLPNIAYIEWLEKKHEEMLQALIEYHKLSHGACYNYCGNNTMTKMCDNCKLGEHRIKCQDIIEPATEMKIEEVLK